MLDQNKIDAVKVFNDTGAVEDIIKIIHAELFEDFRRAENEFDRSLVSAKCDLLGNFERTIVKIMNSITGEDDGTQLE